MINLNWKLFGRKQKQKPEGKDTDTLLSSQEPTEQDICGEGQEMNQLNDLELLSIVQSIKELPFKDFIECCCNNAYQLIVKAGFNPSNEQHLALVYSGWINLLSQYYEVCGDNELNEQFRIAIEMKVIDSKRDVLAVLETLMLETFNEPMADMLREIFPNIPFTKETVKEDFEKAKRLDVETRVRYDQLKSTLQSLVGDTGKKDKELSAAAQEESFYNTLFDINQMEKGAYTKEISTYEFALLRKRLVKHIENLQSQNK